MRNFNSGHLDYVKTTSRQVAKNINNQVYRNTNTYDDYLKLVRAVTYRNVDTEKHCDMILQFRLKVPGMNDLIIQKMRTVIINEMNRTLLTGKIGRISAMDIEFSTPMTPENYYNWDSILYEHFKKAPVFGTITGPQGGGKTHCAVWVAEHLTNSGLMIASNITLVQAKPKKGWNVQIRNGMDKYTQVKNLSDIFNLAKGTVIILDETGIHWSKKDATTKKSKNMGKIIRLFRKRGLSLVLIDQYYDTIPTDFKKLDVFQIRRNKRRVASISTPTVQMKIKDMPIHTYQFDTEELPSFNINVNIDEFLNKIET